MLSNRFKEYLAFHWLKVTLISIAGILVTAIVILSIIGFGAFSSLEAFYRKTMLAGIPLQIFFMLGVGTISAAISTTIFVYFVWGGGMDRLGGVSTKVRPEDVNVHWSDVVGMEEVKKEVWEVITLIKDRVMLQRVGGRLIKGTLLLGPPGCGKTYLAKAIATETGLPFLSAVGSEFIGKFVGTGAARMQSLFREARIYSKIHGGCIVFIDEIDTIARPRGLYAGTGGGMSHDATINQLLTELDGLRKVENNIVVIAASNISEEYFDPALMRAGRFDRKIYIQMPRLKDRKELFDYYLKKIDHDPAIDSFVLAKRALWFSAADIESMVRESTLIAIRNKRRKVTYKDLSEAYDRVVFGLKSNIILSDKEKESTAYHEAGHAIITYLLHPTDDVIKATIIPRKSTLGFVAFRPQDEMHTYTKEYFLAKIKTALGGYVAEKLRYGTTTSGVSVDFSNALWTAHNMVLQYGMGPSGLLGNFDALSTTSQTVSGSYRYQGGYTLSEETRKKIESDTQQILNNCIKEVEAVLTKERELLDNFAKLLIAKEELEYDEIVEIFEKYGKERSKESYL